MSTLLLELPQRLRSLVRTMRATFLTGGVGERQVDVLCLDLLVHVVEDLQQRLREGVGGDMASCARCTLAAAMTFMTSVISGCCGRNRCGCGGSVLSLSVEESPEVEEDELVPPVIEIKRKERAT